MQATADKGAFSLGFQMLTFPQTAAIIAFQAQTAREIKCAYDSNNSQRMPLFIHSMLWSFTMHS